ncbi:MAG: DegT/DnrJ/EryC1/StrS family aminotransferase [Mucilaginibacter sp.]
MIPHNRPSLSKQEAKAAFNIIKSNMLVRGKQIEKFENEFCDYMGLPHGHAVAVSSGTSALYLSSWVLGLKNKTIAIPAYSCTALKNAVKMNNCKIEYLDNEIDSPNLDIEELNGLKTDACIVPHMFGIPIDMDRIKNDIIIEDCCQSLGAMYNNQKVGLNGIVGVFSFYATKLITSAGHGGMVISKDAQIIKEIKDYINFDMKNDNIDRFNFQLTEMQAAVGRVQLKKLNNFLSRREDIFNIYQENGFNLEKSKLPNSKQVFYRAVLKANNSGALMSLLLRNKIKSIIPVTVDELLDRKKNCIDYCNNTISIPVYPTLKNTEVNKIVNIIKQKIN